MSGGHAAQPHRQPPAWPCCPDCGRRRRTECPICGVSGSDIPLADRWEDVEPLRDTRGPRGKGLSSPTASDPPGSSTAHESPGFLLVCPCCDEPYPPRFFRYCEWCGHDFGQGLRTAEDPEPLGPRATWTAIGLLALAIGLLAWFRFVLS